MMKPGNRLAGLVWWIVGALIAAVVVLWLVTPFAISQLYPAMQDRGQFGDLYGAINALFSGLALGGVIIAIVLQSHELRDQRAELRLQRHEMARTASAQELSISHLERTIYANTFQTVYGILQSNAAVESRRRVLEYGESDSNHAEAVARAFDAVGIMVKRGLIPEDYVIDEWLYPLSKTWETLEGFIARERGRFDEPLRWQNYERMAHVAKMRIREMARNNST